jgi:hypothetical protein
MLIKDYKPFRAAFAVTLTPTFYEELSRVFDFASFKFDPCGLAFT